MEHVSGLERARPRYNVAFYVPWLGASLTDQRSPSTGGAGTQIFGGAETQIFLLARGLARRGVKVRLVVFELPGTAIPASVDDVNIRVRPPYRSQEQLGKLREIANVFRAVISADADVIVTRSAGPHVGLVGFFARISRRRFVYSSANLSDFDFSRLPTKRRNHFLFRLGIRMADEIVVQTPEQLRLCQERFDRSPVLINSIAEPAPQRDREPEAFLWIGRLVWYKRPLAFVELARSLPEARFWMIAVPMAHASEGPELMGTLERDAATLPNLELLSPRPRRELMDLIDRAVAVVNTADFEGMPNVFLEGWARGVPALALTHDPNDVIQRHGLGDFAQGSSKQLADLARQMWDERGDQGGIAARCRQYIHEHHSPESVSARWEEIVGSGRRRRRRPRSAHESSAPK